MTRSALALLLAAAVALGAQAAMAKPKKTDFSGCTEEAFQKWANTYEGRLCLAKLDEDVMKGHSHSHNLYCSGGRGFCCISEGSQVVACVELSALKSSTLPPGKLPDGGVLQIPGSGGTPQPGRAKVPLGGSLSTQ